MLVLSRELVHNNRELSSPYSTLTATLYSAFGACQLVKLAYSTTKGPCTDAAPTQKPPAHPQDSPGTLHRRSTPPMAPPQGTKQDRLMALDKRLTTVNRQ